MSGERAGQAFDHGSQAARRGEGFDVLVFEPGLTERIAEQAREIVPGAALHARGDLFGKQLKQELSHD